MKIKKKYSISIMPLSAHGHGWQFRISNITVAALVLCMLFTVAFSAFCFIGIMKVSRENRDDEKMKVISQLQEKYETLKKDYDLYKTASTEHIKMYETSLSDIYQILGVKKSYIESDSYDGRGGPLSTMEENEALSVPDHIITDGLKQIIDISTQTAVICNLLAQNEDQASRLPAFLPIIDNKDYTITDGFGWRTHPVYGKKDFHKGLDIASKYRTKIVAPANGVVSWVGYRNGYGRTVTIDHGKTIQLTEDGRAEQKRFKTRYTHLSKALVKKGAKIKKGDVIALMGSTGLSTGVHLHYEVEIDGKHVDPMDFVLDVK